MLLAAFQGGWSGNRLAPRAGTCDTSGRAFPAVPATSFGAQFSPVWGTVVLSAVVGHLMHTARSGKVDNDEKIGIVGEWQDDNGLLIDLESECTDFRNRYFALFTYEMEDVNE